MFFRARIEKLIEKHTPVRLVNKNNLFASLTDIYSMSVASLEGSCRFSNLFSYFFDSCHRFSYLIPYFHFFAVPASGLSNLKVYIPDTVLRGHNIQFNCTFTLEDEKLFAIKWYRGNYEIFRYLPSSDVPMKTFPLEGYNVSVSIYYTAVFYQVRIYLFVKMSILDVASFPVIIFVESTRRDT